MKTFRDFYLGEQEINYDVNNVKTFIARNINDAKQLLRKNRDFVKEINNATNLKQFDTEEQRDLLSSAYMILQHDPEFASQIGLDIKDAEKFSKEIKSDIIDPTRKVANSLNIKTPSIAQVKSFEEKASETEKNKAIETKEKPEEPTKEAPEDDEEETPEDNEETPEDDEEKVHPDQDYDESEYPDPKKISKQIEAIRDKTRSEIEQLRKENPDRLDASVVDRRLKQLDSRLNKLADDARRQETAYKVNPTRMSKIRASNKAKTALEKAKAESSVLKNTTIRKQLPSRLERTGQRVAEVGKKAYEKGKELAQSRTAKNIKDVAGRVLKNVGSATKRAAEIGKKEAQRTITNVKQNISSKEITDFLGLDKANEYIDLLKQGKTDEANKIAAQAKEAKNKAYENQRLNRLKSSALKRENQALKSQSLGRNNVKSAVAAKQATDKFKGTA